MRRNIDFSIKAINWSLGLNNCNFKITRSGLIFNHSASERKERFVKMTPKSDLKLGNSSVQR
jgi:hypothetical protein